MNWTSKFSRLVPACALVAILGMPSSATADEHESKNDKKLAVFELEHQDPRHLSQLITLLDRASADADQAQQSTQQQRQQAARPGQRGIPGQASRQRVTAGFRGESADQLVTAFNSEAGILFVRGKEDQIEKVEELVKALDSEGDDLKAHDYSGMRLVPACGTVAAEIAETLSRLNLQGQTLQMGELALVVFHKETTDENKLQQAEQVIDALNDQAKESKERAEKQKDKDSEKDKDQAKDSDDDQDNGDNDEDSDES